MEKKMKALLINGSPHEKGSTFTALSFIKEALNEEGVEAEILHITNNPVSGCDGCGACRESGLNRCVIDGDIVNAILEKAENIDALVVGAPTYFAAPNGQILSVLDRVFYCGSGLFKGKPAAAITVARRAGTTATLSALQKYFVISGMPIAPSTYWPMIHGYNPSDVVQDKEGVQIMKMTGKTIAWLVKCIAAGETNGIYYPEVPGGEKIKTNFIR